MLEKLGKSLRRRFFTGLLVVTPVAITIFFIRFLFGFMDGLLGPVLTRVLGFHLPGLGIISTVVIIFLVGLATANFVGKKMVWAGEALVTRLPLIKTIYTSSKQLAEAIFLPHKDTFKRVVLVEYPRKGSYALGFVTSSFTLELAPGEKKEVASVFVPSTPIPTTGWVLILPAEELIPMSFSVEAGFRLIISGGVINPLESASLGAYGRPERAIFSGLGASRKELKGSP